MSTQNAIQTTQEKPQTIQLSQIDDIGYFSGPAFALLQKAADYISKSSMIPKEFSGNSANCAIALNMSKRIGADPMMVMQNIYIVHGRPGWSAKFLTATFNACGDFSKIRYEWKNQEKPNDPEYGCRAYATEKATGEVLYGPWITWKVVRAEKWDAKDGSKWKTIPELMFMYRAAAWFINTHSPEISMGIRTTDEIEDIENAKDITGSSEIIERTTNFPPAFSGPVTDVEVKQVAQVATPAPQTSTSSTRAATSRKADKPAAPATSAGNPVYADSEPDPFAPGGELFGREPGMEG